MNAKLGYEINPDAAKRLLAAIIEQAVDDLKGFQRAGTIVAGKVVLSGKKFRDMKTVAPALQLLHFFEPDGMAEKTMLMLGCETNFQSVRRALNLEPQLPE
jgi:hypothetical protein